MMPGKRSIRILCLLLVLLAGGIVTAAAAAAPFSFSVSPEHAEAAPGSSVAYTITITASPGFSDPISFTMDASSFGICAGMSFMLCTRSLDVGTSRGPYPQTIFYTLEVPREVPPGVTVKATVTGTSGSDQITQDLDIKVKGQGGILETLFGTIISVIDKILSALGMGK